MSSPDQELIDNIKNHEDVTNSLGELVNRHSGIYFDIVSRYVPATSIYCDRQDLFDDKDFNIRWPITDLIISKKDLSHKKEEY